MKGKRKLDYVILLLIRRFIGQIGPGPLVKGGFQSRPGDETRISVILPLEVFQRWENTTTYKSLHTSPCIHTNANSILEKSVSRLIFHFEESR